MKFELRDYQKDAVQEYRRRIMAGQKRVMICAPTGSGKTFLSMDLIQRARKKGSRVDFLCDRESLILQTSDRFREVGIDHGCMQGPNTWGTTLPVRILSSQTVRARNIRLNADLTIVDEAHICHKAVTSQMTGERAWLGLSASPFREGLADLWESVLNVRTTHRLVQDGWLAPLKVYCGKPVRSKKKNSNGEYDKTDLASNVLEIVGDIVAEWEEKTNDHFGGPVKTIAFANTVRDAEELATSFQDRGHDFQAVSYVNKPEEKRELIERHRAGDLMGLISIEALQRGYDVPDILCGIDAHPWRKNFTGVVQMGGRPMRAFPGKKYSLWLDHAQNILRFRDRLFEFWRMGCLELTGKLDKEAGPDQPDRKESVCPKCNALLVARRCRECGWEIPRRKVASDGSTAGVMSVNGKLVELDPSDTRRWVARIGRTEYTLPYPTSGWLEICALARNRKGSPDKKQKWCQAQYRKLYGKFRTARFNQDASYPPTSRVIHSAIEHSTKLFIDRMKRDAKKRKSVA